ncbi:MAG TPA: hypothetical protein VGQ73_07215 [Gemmatimonadales bacterium]|jgi:hypothetical protein|nr:hypothetical protein [Gemmatimonadales bacterium]
MRKIDALRQLQDMDTGIDAARTVLVQLEGEIGDRRALDQREAEVAAARADLHALQAQQRDLELQAEDRRTKIQADEGKLYGGRVTNPKELQSLSEEVAQDRRQLDDVEYRLLELLERSDEISRRLAGLETSLAQATQEWNAKQQTARSRVSETQGQLQTLEQRRSSAWDELDAESRSTYTALRRQKGTAVATVHQRTCQACRVSLTASQEQRARIGTELVTCHSCGRVLYVSLG